MIGNFDEIRQLLQVVRMHTGRIERVPIMRHVVIGVPERPLQALELQAAQFVLACRLDWVEFVALRGFFDHECLR